ncbi:MAG TPA: hypothetical protein VIL35_07600 [Vicinamibacterales bacterium]
MSMLDLTDLLLPVLLLGAPQAPPASAKAPTVMEAPKLPPFAGEIVNFDRRGDRVVACVNAAAAPARPGMPKPSSQAAAAAPPRYRIWVLEREIMQELLTSGGLCDPSWSPDGKSFAAAGARGVFTFSEPHFEPRALVAGQAESAEPGGKPGGRVYADPVWSPSGDRLAFRVTGDGADRVEVVDVKSAEVLLRRDISAKSLRWVDAKTVAADDTRLSVP